MILNGQQWSCPGRCPWYLIIHCWWHTFQRSSQRVLTSPNYAWKPQAKAWLMPPWLSHVNSLLFKVTEMMLSWLKRVYLCVLSFEYNDFGFVNCLFVLGWVTVTYFTSRTQTCCLMDSAVKTCNCLTTVCTYFSTYLVTPLCHYLLFSTYACTFMEVSLRPPSSLNEVPWERQILRKYMFFLGMHWYIFPWDTNVWYQC